MSETSIRIRPGLIDRLRQISGLASDEAFARAIGASRSTVAAVKAEEREPSMQFAVGIAEAFGLGLSEIIVWEPSAKRDGS